MIKVRIHIVNEDWFDKEVAFDTILPAVPVIGSQFYFRDETEKMLKAAITSEIETAKRYHRYMTRKVSQESLTLEIARKTLDLSDVFWVCRVLFWDGEDFVRIEIGTEEDLIKQ